jgi:hypothetical protein
MLAFIKTQLTARRTVVSKVNDNRIFRFRVVIKICLLEKVRRTTDGSW